ncbi:MAG: hypothetical protein KF819_30675 [Labilithrix sp.]|nr:hypothetical protein [Labilithrix sp.]
MRALIITYRRALVVATHLVLWTASLLLAVALRFEFDIPSAYGPVFARLLPLVLLVRALVHWHLGLFHGLWRYSGARDLRSLIWAATLSSVCYASAWAFTGFHTFPRSVFVLDWAFSIMIVGGLRFSIRTLREVSIQAAMPKSGPKRLRARRRRCRRELDARDRPHLSRRYEPVGLLDDNPSKHGERIHGVPVCSELI